MYESPVINARSGTYYTTDLHQVKPHCPITGEEVRKDHWTIFVSQDNQVSWWHCPVCYGWHILMTNLYLPKK